MRFSRGAAFLAASLSLTFAGKVDAYTLKTLYSFCAQPDCTDGSGPASRPIMDSAGNLYVTTTVGGTANDGTVVELIPQKNGSWKEKVLYSFDDSKGALPQGNLIMDVSGNLYGTTVVNNAFELVKDQDRNKWSLKVLHTFCSRADCADGNSPESGLTYQGAASGAPYDGVSPLYGTTDDGGSGQSLGGVAFMLTNDGGQWKEDVLHSFCSKGGLGCHDGNGVPGGLIVDSAGNVFGTTRFGGREGVGGVVFALAPDTPRWKETKLHTFCRQLGCPDGGESQTEPWIDGMGNIFGVTTSGGTALNCSDHFSTSQCGVIYQLTPSGRGYKETVLYVFCASPDCTDGAFPISGFTPDGAGHLIGTTLYGGTGGSLDQWPGSGTVYIQAGQKHEKLYSFCSQTNCIDGANPAAGVLVDSAGDIFGTTSSGGAYGMGTVFELIP